MKDLKRSELSRRTEALSRRTEALSRRTEALSRRTEALSRRDVLKMALSGGALAVLPQLPVLSAPLPPVQHVVQESVEPPGLAAITAQRPILVVDDCPDWHPLYQMLFERLANAAVIGVTTSHRALKICREQPVSLIISDVMRPDLNGFEMLEILKADDRTRHIPVVFVSAYCSTAENVMYALDLGASDVITKPIYPINEFVPSMTQLIGQDWPPPVVPGIPEAFDPTYVLANWSYRESQYRYDIYGGRNGLYVSRRLRPA